MNYTEFVKLTVAILNQDTFEALKAMLVGEYLTFSIIEAENITPDILAEKICDYFEKMEIKTGKSFDKQLETYFRDIDSIVNERIVKTPKPKKEMPAQEDCRARKYYNKAISKKNVRNVTASHLVDYTRIMFCLYTAIMNNQFNEIINFDFSMACLKPKVILEAMKNESNLMPLKIGKKNRFDINDLYCADTETFIITIILLHKIINSKVQGEYGNE